MSAGRAGTRRRSRDSTSSRRAGTHSHRRCVHDASTDVLAISRGVWVPDRVAWTRQRLQRHLPIFPVAQARFLQIEVAFDPPPGFVGDLAVAQQDVDEFPFGCDQLPRQRGAGRRDVVGVGIERIRQLVAADLVPRAQQLDDFVGEFAVVGDGIERLERRIERLAPRRDLGFMLRDDARCGRPWRRRAIAPRAAIPSPSPTSVMKMTPKATNRIRSRWGKARRSAARAATPAPRRATPRRARR